MLLKTMLFALLWNQSICYIPQCTNLTFGKCSNKSYCGITDTGIHNCLPCSIGKLCPGDGYMYSIEQLNGKYIVSPSKRSLKFKKIGKIVKIVKIGLKVAAIAKTGGVAALKAKATQLAINKGLQCLKNGLSNFCNGKGKLAKLKNTITKAKGLVSKVKSVKGKLSGIKDKVASKVKPVNKKLSGIKNKVASKVKSVNKKLSGIKDKVASKVKSAKGKLSKIKKIRTNLAKNKGIKEIIKNTTCKKVIDNVAQKVNSVTKNVAKSTVNRGRDWLNNKLGCDKTPTKTTHLRGSVNKNNNENSHEQTDAPTPETDSIPNSGNRPPKKQPIARTDDTVTTRPPKKQPIARIDQRYPPGAQDNYVSFPSLKPVTKNGKELDYPKGGRVRDHAVVSTWEPLRGS